jgi:excisionase family DNA binding protein
MDADTTSAQEPPLRLFTIAEATALLNVPEGWLRKKVSARAVPYTRLGKHVRFSPDHLQAVVAAGEAAIEEAAAMPRQGLSRRTRRTARAAPVL